MEEEYENYIDIDDQKVLRFNDWIYDTIINRTIKELEDSELLDLIEFVNEAKRGADGFLILSQLEKREYKILCRHIRRAYNKSLDIRRKLYSRKAANQLLRDFKNLISELIRDERFFE
ncbi:MAG: hypothetical protein H7263_11840 [Candidatus Sericytochromatia bacterium]|nr:hypothetical protein [Candidatus Sericytochromatia bacterium]